MSNPYVGQGAYTLRLVSGLQRRYKNEFRVVVSQPTANANDAFESRIICLPARRLITHEFANRIIDNARVLRLVAKCFPDSVFHSPGPIAGLNRPARTVVTIHDSIYRSFPNYLGRLGLRKLYMSATESFARRASLVLTDSEFSKRQLLEQMAMDSGRTEVLYPWVGTEFVESMSDLKLDDARRRYGLPHQFWLYIGGYDYRKNVEFLIRGYAAVSSREPVLPLVLAGRIPKRASRVTCDVMGELKRTGLTTDKVLMPGAISNSDLPAVYKAASLFIFPSLMEGFGLPPAEAMATGTPVLVSDVSSLPEVVKDGSCRFDPKKLDSLIDKLQAAKTNYSKFRSPLPDRFTEEFGIKRYLDLIDRVATSNYGAT